MKAPLLIVAATIALAATLTSCGDAEEDVAPQPTATVTAGTGTPGVSSTPAPATPVRVPSGWKGYTDPILSFSLSYPSDLVFKDLTGSSVGRRHLQFRSETDRSRSFTVGIIENSKGLALEQWVHEYTACLPETIEPSTVSGKPAVFCTSQPEGTMTEPTAIFEQSGKMFLITTLMPSAEFELVIASIRP